MSGSNITVDDHDLTQVTYVGDNWHAQPGCTVCTATLPASDLENVLDATWHDGLFHSTDPDAIFTAQLTFIGTAIYVFGITVSNNTYNVGDKNQDLLFYIDNKPVDGYTFTPSGPEYTYNVPFFSQTGLVPTQHTLLVSVKRNLFVLLDYLIYTQPSGITATTAAVSSTTVSHSTDSAAATTSLTATSNSGSGTPPVGTIVGAVAGSLGGITIIVLVRYYREGYFDYERRMNGQPNRGQDPGAPALNPINGSVPGHTGSTNRLPGPNTVEPFIVPPPSLLQTQTSLQTSGVTNGRFLAEKSSGLSST